MKELKKLSILFLFVLLLLPISKVKAQAWDAENITLSNIEFSSSDMVSFDISFDVPEGLGSAISWIGLQSGEFATEGGNFGYGDFTNLGEIALTYHFINLTAVKNNTNFVNQYGIKGFAPNDDIGFPIFGLDESANTHIEQSLNFEGLPIDTEKDYNIYLWTKLGNSFYPDAYLGKLTIDGNGNFDIIDSTGDKGTIEGYYKVTFDTNGGSDVANQTVKEDDKTVEPEDPTKEGYVLEGWYTDPELTNKFDFDTPVTEEITLYAKWVVEYKMLSDDQTYKLKSNVNIVFKAEGELSKVTGIMIDDKEVAESNYELESGSTILTLKSSYLDTLSVGSHKLTIKYNDGFASTNFVVKEADVTNPSTGDNIIYYVVLFSICLSTIIVCKKIKL